MTHKNRTITLEIRDKKYTCKHFTDRAAIFFGTLLMDNDELRVCRDDEQPERAMQMMSDRLRLESEEVKKILQDGKISESDLNEKIGSEVITKIANRLTSRTIFDWEDCNRLIAAYLKSSFPELAADGLITDAGINMDIAELVSSIAIPLFGFLNEAIEQPPAPVTPPPETAPAVPVPVIVMPEVDPKQQAIEKLRSAGLNPSELQALGIA